MKRICGECGKRPAKFRYRRWVRADDDHWVCFKCWRGLRQAHQEGLKIMQRTFDSQGQKLNSGIFAEAYRATIPVLADAKHVTIRMSNIRRSELFDCGGDVADVVEVGSVTEEIVNPSSGLKGLASKTRAVAVPVDVHVKDGAEVVADDAVNPAVISFEVNGIAEVQIINLALTAAEQSAIEKAAAAKKALEDKNQQSDFDKQLAAAKEEGRKQALLEQAKAAGAASVAKTEAPKSDEPPKDPTIQ
jgi:hypothetical protein